MQVLPLNVAFRGRDYLDHQDISAAGMFLGLSDGSELPSTRPPTIDQFRIATEYLLARQNHVLSVHLSSHLSETVNIARQAASFYPGRTTVIDSQQSSGALAMQAERAARLLRGGIPPDVIVEVLKSASALACTRMSLDTLDFLSRNGRIGAAAFLVGGLLDMKPIVGLEDGRVIGVGRERGRAQAHQRLVKELLVSIGQRPAGGVRVVVFHNGELEGANLLKAAAREAGAKVMMTSLLGTVLSAHGGPGVCGFSSEPTVVYHQFRAY